MSKIPTITLTIFSLIWLFYAIPVRSAAKTSSVSHAMALESELKAWADENASPEAVEEIFEDSYSLKLGGESDKLNFREMIRGISQKSAIPIWPGLIGLLVGIVGAIRSKPEPKSTKDRQAEASMDTSKL